MSSADEYVRQNKNFSQHDFLVHAVQAVYSSCSCPCDSTMVMSRIFGLNPFTFTETYGNTTHLLRLSFLKYIMAKVKIMQPSQSPQA